MRDSSGNLRCDVCGERMFTWEVCELHGHVYWLCEDCVRKTIAMWSGDVF